MTTARGSRLEHRLRWMILLGAIVLCAATVSCSKARSSRKMPLLDGTGIGKLKIDKATVRDAAKTFRVPADNARDDGRGIVEMRTPLFQLSFVPPTDGQGPPRLYSVRTLIGGEDIYRGKTSKGIGFLDTVDAMREAYGEPDGEWRREG